MVLLSFSLWHYCRNCVHKCFQNIWVLYCSSNYAILQSSYANAVLLLHANSWNESTEMQLLITRSPLPVFHYTMDLHLSRGKGFSFSCISLPVRLWLWCDCAHVFLWSSVQALEGFLWVCKDLQKQKQILCNINVASLRFWCKFHTLSEKSIIYVQNIKQRVSPDMCFIQKSNQIWSTLKKYFEYSKKIPRS